MHDEAYATVKKKNKSLAWLKWMFKRLNSSQNNCI